MPQTVDFEWFVERELSLIPTLASSLLLAAQTTQGYPPSLKLRTRGRRNEIAAWILWLSV
jgi:hypothetical protein